VNLVIAFAAGLGIGVIALGGAALRAITARTEMHQALCAVIHQNKLLRGEILAECANADAAPETPVIWPEEIEL
jgi:hypothetical protein